MADTDRLLVTAAEVTRKAILERYSATSCIATTRAMIEVLRYFGVTARPWACNIRAFNAAGWDAMEAGLAEAGWPDGAWCVSIDAANGPQPGEPAVGHLAAVTKTRLIDASIDQAARPARHLPLAPFAAALPDGFDPSAMVLHYRHPDGPHLLYGPSGCRSYLTSPNWRKDDPYIRATVAEAIREVRARMAAAA